MAKLNAIGGALRGRFEVARMKAKPAHVSPGGQLAASGKRKAEF